MGSKVSEGERRIHPLGSILCQRWQLQAFFAKEDREKKSVHFSWLYVLFKLEPTILIVPNFEFLTLYRQ
jgi:hypothetical protein